MEHRRAWITVADGTRLAARLWLPGRAPGAGRCSRRCPTGWTTSPRRTRPSTSGSAEEGGFAVCRLDIRGTGSSEGIATDEYTAEEHDDICEVIAWLAAQEWSNGRVGMYGTSWSGFNSLQVACRAPACARRDRADLRVRRPLHRRRPLHGRRAEGGRPRRLGALHGRAATPSPRCPPSSATAGARSGRGGSTGIEPWLLRWLEEQSDGPYWRHGSVRPGLRADRLPDDDRRRLGRRLPQQHVPHASRRSTCPKRCSSGPWSHMSTATSLPGPAHRPRAGADPLVRPLARATSANGDRRRSRRSPSSRAARRGPRPTSRRCAASGAARRRGRPSGSREHDAPPRRRRASTRSTSAATSAAPPGSRARAAARGGSRDDQRVDDALLARLRLGAARGRARRDGPPARCG